MTQVFISYSSKDRPFVQRLSADLKQRLPSVDIFYDMLLPPGSSFAEQLAVQIEKADIVIAVLSPDYLASPWAKRELDFALEQQLKNSARLLPIMIRPCAPPPFLSQFTWADFTEDYDFGLMRLVWGITGERPINLGGAAPGSPARPMRAAEAKTLLQDVQRSTQEFKARTDSSSERAGFAPEGKVAGAKRRCFVVMPFGSEDLEIVYRYFVKPNLEERCHLDCERGDDVFGANVVMDDILKSIRAADVVIADLTGKNANVFYEIGICHTLDKPVLLMAQSIDDVPFDLRHRRILLYDYTPRGCKLLESKVTENMSALLADVP